LNKKFLAVLIPILAVNLIFLVYGLYEYSLAIPNSGSTKIYGLDPEPDSIFWGNMTISEARIRSVNLTNTGNEALTNLNITTSDVVGLTDFVLSWNLEGYEIQPDQTLQADFTLTVYEASQKDFSFFITVNGE